MSAGLALGIFAGRSEEFADQRGRWRSAVRKRPLAGPVAIAAEGILGDEHADPRHHGGPEKALLAMPASALPLWPTLLPGFRPQPGDMGENLLIAGADETTVCIGDRWMLGGCLLRTTQPRRPCWKPGRLAGVDGLAAAMARHGRTGWYLAVERAGTAAAGDAWACVARPHPQWTIMRANTALHGADAELSAAFADAASCPERWRPGLRERARRLRAGETAPADPAWTPIP